MPRSALLLSLAIAAVAIASSRSEEPPKSINFARDVRPIFAKHCLACHGPEKQRSGLRLDRKADALRGGDSGLAIVDGKPSESLLLTLVSGDDKDRVMPPKGERLSAADLGVLKAWIEQGAKWPDDPAAANLLDWWSLKPIVKRAMSDGAANPIDAFILAKLSEKGLVPSREGDRRTLIRRLYFDLIGLPPTPDEIAEFERDSSADAYLKLVDRLLASPRYGERWARHWLDVIHFGETHGYDKDKPRPNAWPYRDYVIRAFNDDKPYARFVQEQVAGDVLFPGTVDGIEALGFLAAGPWDFIGHEELPETKIDGKVARHLDRDDFVANTVGSFMSLTAHCAQCHNHKFDPITQEDYYSLQAVFAAIDRTDTKYDVDAAVATRRADLAAKKRDALAAIADLAREARSWTSADWTDLGRRLVGLHGPELRSWPEWQRALAKREAVDAEIKKLPPQKQAFVGGVHRGKGNFAGTGPNGGKPRPIFVLNRGTVTKPGREVGPGAIAAIPQLAGRFNEHDEGARRAALSRWLTDANNPLVWRSIVNRVWQYHFGRGIVDTPNDFGRMGQLPTHPELLDWLAADFRDTGGSLKRLHRLIVTSATYRQSSATNPAYAKIDADNRYLWRQNRRKLEAEAVRDSILSVAGKLDLSMGGPSFQDFVIEKPEHSPHYQYHLHDPEDAASHRRSIYRFVVRSKQQPFMAALDCADPSLAVEKRNQTITPQQALALLNNRLALAMAAHFATRVEPLGKSIEERVAVAFRLAIGRIPIVTEQDALSSHARDHGLANTCRVILNLNEFVFVD